MAKSFLLGSGEQASYWFILHTAQLLQLNAFEIVKRFQTVLTFVQGFTGR